MPVRNKQINKKSCQMILEKPTLKIRDKNLFIFFTSLFLFGLLNFFIYIFIIPLIKTSVIQ
jgi:hypothetical protein